MQSSSSQRRTSHCRSRARECAGTERVVTKSRARDKHAAWQAKGRWPLCQGIAGDAARGHFTTLVWLMASSSFSRPSGAAVGYGEGPWPPGQCWPVRSQASGSLAGGVAGDRGRPKTRRDCALRATQLTRRASRQGRPLEPSRSKCSSVPAVLCRRSRSVDRSVFASTVGCATSASVVLRDGTPSRPCSSLFNCPYLCPRWATPREVSREKSIVVART